MALPKYTGMAVEVGQTPDVWDNAYFDGGYFHNGKIVDAKGFCTDVFFREGNRFIRESVKKNLSWHTFQRTHPMDLFIVPKTILICIKASRVESHLFLE